MENNEDQVWLDVLAGKPVKTSDKNLVLNAKLLRSSIQQKLKEDEYEENQLAKLHIRLEAEANNRKSNLSKRLRLLVIFIIGLIAGALIPMQLAVRGKDVNILHGLQSLWSQEKINSHLVLHKEDPLLYSHKLIDISIEEGLAVTISGEDQYLLTIKGLHAYKNLSIKAEVGLLPELEGNAQILVVH